MLVLIDNYDSFTYNLVQYFGDLGENVQVYRNNKLSAADVLELNPDGIVISPGPCDPDKADICLELIALAAQKNTPLLGVCLGHQAIGQAFGGRIIRGEKPMHGKITDIIHYDDSVFKGLPSPYPATRYHSLIVSKENLPDALSITAETKDGVIMGIRHKEKPIHGVQFHPESIATENSHKLLENFIGMTR